MVIKKYIKGGLNSDVNPSLVPDGDYLNALNIRGQLGDDGKAGVIRPVPGHTKKTNVANDLNGSLQSSTQDVKHICVDDVGGYAYAFVSGSVDLPGLQIVPPKITRINLIDFTKDDILLSNDITSWEPIGDISYLWDDFVEAKVVGDTLIWVNKFGYQFSINVKAYFDQPSGDPKFISEQIGLRDISLIKAPPVFNLLAQKLEDQTYSASGKPNYVKDNVFQFAYRYVYAGYEQSVVSPWSTEVPLNIEGDDFNYVKITIPLTEKIPPSVLYIDLLCKNNLTGSINLIKRFSTLDQNFVDQLLNDHNNGTSSILFDFYNDNVYESIDNPYFIKQFDSVPIKSYSLEVSKDRLFLANNTEGYDTPESISLTSVAITAPVLGSRDIDYSLQSWDIEVGLIDDTGPEEEDIQIPHYYVRNIFFIDGISQPAWYYVNGETGPGTGVSHLIQSFSLSKPNPSLSYTCVIGGDFTGHTYMNIGAEIYVEGFLNNNNNGFYTIEERSNSQLTVVKSQQVSGIPEAVGATSGVKITLLSSAVGDDEADALSNQPPPIGDAFSNLIIISTSDNTLVQTTQYWRRRGDVPLNDFRYSNYTLIDTVPTAEDVSITGLPTSQSRTFKSFSRYNLGIQFYDFALRKCGVATKCKNNLGELIDITVSTPDRSYTAVDQTLLSWTLPSGIQLEIPEWAKYYSIVRTDNLNTRYFIQGSVNGLKVRYVKKKSDIDEYDLAGVITYNDTIAGVAIDLESIINDGFGYIYEESNNDVVKLYKSTGSPISLKVIGQQGRFIILEPKDINAAVSLPNTDTPNWARYEITRPYRQTGSETFYENNLYSVNNWGTSTRSYSQTYGSIFGDTFIFGNLEYMNLRKEFRNLWFRNLGRACFIDPIGQVYRPSGIRWSNVFIPGSKVNGLSTLDALDYKDLPVELGPVNKLKTTSKAQSEGNVMLAIGQNYTASLYIGETSLVDNAGQTLLTTSGSIVGTVNVLKGKFGTTIPSSVVEYDGNVYWADMLNECIVRYSANGLFAISDYGMRNFFRSYFKEKKAFINEFDITQSPHIYGGYNPATDEYILSFTPVSNTQEQYPDSSAIRHSDIKNMYRSGTQAKSVGFSLSQERWSSFYSHGGPYIYFGGKMYSFVKSVYSAGVVTPIISGGLFEFDKDSTINSFSGSAKDSFISIPYNDATNNIKVFQAISIEGDTAPTTAYVETFIPNNQITNMVSSDFVNREDMLYSEIFRDRISPNACGTADQKMYIGDKIRGQYANMSLVWSNPSSFAIRFINVNVKDSIGHSKLSQ